jgi:alcohol dehydrogenase class IV
MALAQYVTAMAYSNVGLGIAHSMAHTLGAVYDTPHGVACAMFLPITMEFNRDYCGERYREIARAMGVKGVDEMSKEAYTDAAIAAVRQLSEDVGIPKKNEKIREEDLDQLATDALKILSHFAFNRLGLNRLEISASVTNKASQAVATRAGYTQEGFSREFERINGKFEDHVRFSRLARDPQ